MKTINAMQRRRKAPTAGVSRQVVIALLPHPNRLSDMTAEMRTGPRIESENGTEIDIVIVIIVTTLTAPVAAHVIIPHPAAPLMLIAPLTPIIILHTPLHHPHAAIMIMIVIAIEVIVVVAVQIDIDLIATGIEIGTEIGRGIEIVIVSITVTESVDEAIHAHAHAHAHAVKFMLNVDAHGADMHTPLPPQRMFDIERRD